MIAATGWRGNGSTMLRRHRATGRASSPAATAFACAMADDTKSNLGKADAQQAGQARSSTPGQGAGQSSSADEGDEPGQPSVAPPRVGLPGVTGGSVPGGGPMGPAFGGAQENPHASNAAGGAPYAYAGMTNGNGEASY